MTKRELAKKLAGKLENVSIKNAEKLIDTVFETIVEGLEEDGKVMVGKWGTYEIENDNIASNLPYIASNLQDIESNIPGRFTDFPGPLPHQPPSYLRRFSGSSPMRRKGKISPKFGKFR